MSALFDRSSATVSYAVSLRRRLFVLVVMMASASLGISVIGATEGGEEKPVKYAPAYCRSLRFNCRVKAGHVCCRFPLPPTGFVRLRLSLTLCQLSNILPGVTCRSVSIPTTGNRESILFCHFWSSIPKPRFWGGRPSASYVSCSSTPSILFCTLSLSSTYLTEIAGSS